jgi:hypothetical protein
MQPAEFVGHARKIYPGPRHIPDSIMPETKIGFRNYAADLKCYSAVRFINRTALED